MINAEYAAALLPAQLSRLKRIPDRVSVIYVGSDACERLLPECCHLEKIIDLGKKPIAALPALTDFYLNKSCAVIEEFLKKHDEIEVSVNDIGALTLLHNEFSSRVKISIGRILCYLWNKNSIYFTQVMSKKFGISFFETDEEQTASNLMKSNLKVAFHYPYKYYGITRRCFYAQDNQLSAEKFSCSKLCPEKYIPLGKGDVFLRGNAYYSKPAKMPELMPGRIIIPYDSH